MRIVSVVLGLLLFVATPGCGDDSCVKTLSCPDPNNTGGAGEGGGTGGAGGTSVGGGGTTGLPDGAPCKASTDCASSICTDDVCCATACDGSCEACNVVGALGTCAPHAAASDPDNECSEGAGVCDGKRGCASGALSWQVHVGDGENQEASKVGVDSEGNVLFAGRNRVNALSVGSDTVYGAYLAKLDSSGNHLWARTVCFSENSSISDLEILPNDAIALAGTCDGDHFVGLFGVASTQLWFKVLGSAWPARVLLAATPTNDVIVAGYLSFGTFDFGDGHLVTPIGGASELEDMFAVKLDVNGSYQWDVVFGSTGTEYALDAVSDQAGHTVLSGRFAGTVDFGGTVLSDSVGAEVVINLDEQGNVSWVRQMDLGGSGDQSKRDLAIAPEENLMLAGGFSSDTNLGGRVLENQGGSDIVLLTLDGTGSHVASSAYGSVENESASSPSFTTSGILTFLSVGGAADFGGGTQLGTAVVRLATGGEFLWSRDRMPFADAATRPDGSVAVAGTFSAAEAPLSIGSSPIPSAGGDDIVVAVYAP